MVTSREVMWMRAMAGASAGVAGRMRGVVVTS
ncbi:MAG: hypothetical protein QOF84_4583 [Streptomyces sp.]|jgi:hypothetical protein|nr:hypothetical protein [Streptomyces sp.]